MEFVKAGCDMIHFIKSVNKVNNNILSFLKFRNNGIVDPI